MPASVSTFFHSNNLARFRVVSCCELLCVRVVLATALTHLVRRLPVTLNCEYAFFRMFSVVDVVGALLSSFGISSQDMKLGQRTR